MAQLRYWNFQHQRRSMQGRSWAEELHILRGLLFKVLEIGMLPGTMFLLQTFGRPSWPPPARRGPTATPPKKSGICLAMSSSILLNGLRAGHQSVKCQRLSGRTKCFTLPVEQTRPISVLPIRWRVYSKALLNSAAAQWLQHFINPDVCCLQGRRRCGHPSEWSLASKQLWWAVLLGLEPSLRSPRPQSDCRCSAQFGVASGASVWFVNFISAKDGFAGMVALMQAPSWSLRPSLQECLLSPILLAVVVSAGCRRAWADHNIKENVYVDGRAFWSASLRSPMTYSDGFFSDQIGFRESFAKTQRSTESAGVIKFLGVNTVAKGRRQMTGSEIRLEERANLVVMVNALARPGHCCVASYSLRMR